MKKDDDFSEEQLNAFVDGELDQAESSHFEARWAESEEADRRIKEHRELKEFVRHAYTQVPPSRERKDWQAYRPNRYFGSIAAGLLLVAGLVGGFFAHDLLPGEERKETRAVAQQPQNYLLHVVSGDKEHMRTALTYAKTLLESGDPDRRVEIIANENGIDLLRSDVTPFAGEISELQKRNVIFYACARTIKRLESDGIRVLLVPDTRQDFTAIDRVVSRMQEGWHYQKI